MSDDQAYIAPWHSQNSLFKHFQEYLGISKDTDGYSATIIGVQKGGGKTSSTLFKNLKKYPDFEKKDPDCVHLWVKFSAENIVLGVSRRKGFKMFPCGTLFFVFLTKCLSKCPSSTNHPPPALKNIWLRPCSHSLFFLQNTSS